MSVQSSVEQSITRQAARLKALKKIKAALNGLSEEDAQAILARVAEIVQEFIAPKDAA